MDIDCLRKLRTLHHRTGKLGLVGCDLNGRELPFEHCSIGTLLVVHFIPKDWFSLFRLVRPGGLMLVQTMGGQGGNFHELPTAGALLKLFAPEFSVGKYRERPVGPRAANKVAAVLIAQKRPR